MNEQIRKLYEQANIRHTNDYALSGKPREEWRSIPDLFAELIVRECADLVQKHMTRWPEDCELTKQIKQHFGVEK